MRSKQKTLIEAYNNGSFSQACLENTKKRRVERKQLQGTHHQRTANMGMNPLNELTDETNIKSSHVKLSNMCRLIKKEESNFIERVQKDLKQAQHQRRREKENLNLAPVFKGPTPPSKVGSSKKQLLAVAKTVRSTPKFTQKDLNSMIGADYATELGQFIDQQQVHTAADICADSDGSMTFGNRQRPQRKISVLKNNVKKRAKEVSSEKTNLINIKKQDSLGEESLSNAIITVSQQGDSIEQVPVVPVEQKEVKKKRKAKKQPSVNFITEPRTSEEYSRTALLQPEKSITSSTARMTHEKKAKIKNILETYLTTQTKSQTLVLPNLVTKSIDSGFGFLKLPSTRSVCEMAQEQCMAPQDEKVRCQSKMKETLNGLPHKLGTFDKKSCRRKNFEVTQEQLTMMMPSISSRNTSNDRHYKHQTNQKQYYPILAASSVDSESAQQTISIKSSSRATAMKMRKIGLKSLSRNIPKTAEDHQGSHQEQLLGQQYDWSKSYVNESLTQIQTRRQTSTEQQDQSSGRAQLSSYRTHQSSNKDLLRCHPLLQKSEHQPLASLSKVHLPMVNQMRLLSHQGTKPQSRNKERRGGQRAHNSVPNSYIFTMANGSMKE